MRSSRLTAVLAAAALTATGLAAPVAASAGGKDSTKTSSSKAPVVTGPPYAAQDGRKN